MPRRQPDNQPAFGSDSFLDIVANAVGILIILIVLAGLRASRVSVDGLPSEVLTRLLSGRVTATEDERPASETNVAVTESVGAVEPEVSSRDGGATAGKTDTASSRPEAAPGQRAAPPEEPQVASSETALVSEASPTEPGGESGGQRAASGEQPVEPPEPSRPEKLEPPTELAPPASLVRQVETLTRQLESLQKRLSDWTGRRDELQRAAAELTDQLAQLDRQLQQAEQEAKASGRRLARVSVDVERLRQRVAELEEQLRRLEQAPRPVQKIEHRVTPVSHEVDGPEIHFRLAGGRVSVVPLDELLELVKEDIERRRSWLLRFRKHEGRVGPVDGYVLTYLVERTPVSTLEQLQTGRRIVRVSVTRWELQPTDEVVEEDAQTALRPGSRFWTVLLLAPSDATLTFWVYPDSFGLFRKLQRAAQEHGFTVAARPLPFGVPIAGSPFGTRSLGQ